MPRITSTDRIRLSNRAEEEIVRYKGDHALFHRHVHGVKLDPMQVLRMIEMDQHRNTIDYSCRRTRKTSTKELFNLERLAASPGLELGIVAPRQQQSQNNLNYMLEAIKRSDILKAYIAHDRGRQRLSDTSFQFSNGSKASAYGIMGEVDGDSLAIASLEEVDDMPSDRLLSRFLPMLGASERLGLDIKIEPEIRVSGVFKGSDVLQRLIDSGQYHVLPTVDVYLGQELGIINPNWVADMRAQQTEGEWLRQFLCMNISSQNWIWEKHIQAARTTGLKAGLEIADPLPGARYKKRGLLSFGVDIGGHGESAHASRFALVVCEQIGNFVTFPFVKTWPASADDRSVELDLFGLWEYFRPDYAMCDAFGIGLATSLNDRLYSHGLTDVDRRTIGDGKSTQSTWGQWAISPIRFLGHVKHSMASVLRAAFHNGQAAMPHFDEDDQACVDWCDFVRHLGNIKEEKTKADYSSFKMADPKIGDDLFDAACAGVWALVTRGAEDVPTVIGSRVQTRAQLLGESLTPTLSHGERGMMERAA